MKTLRQNARYSIRLLRKNPGFTLVAALTLALGIGANTAIFSVIYAVLLAPMPYPNPDQLVMVWSKVQGSNNVVSAGDYLDWKGQNKTFQDINAWSGANFNFATANQPEQINGSAQTPGFMRMTGNAFLMGRDILPEEGVPGKDHVVILTHRLSRNTSGPTTTIIGKSIQMNSRTLHGDRGAGSRTSRPAQPPVHGATSFQARADQSRLSLVACDGPHEARCVVSASAGRHGRRDQSHRSRPSQKQQGLDFQRPKSFTTTFSPKKRSKLSGC